jgi:hypothetical protein
LIFAKDRRRVSIKTPIWTSKRYDDKIKYTQNHNNPTWDLNLPMASRRRKSLKLRNNGATRINPIVSVYAVIQSSTIPSLIHETMHPHRTILTTTNNPLITQAHTSNRACVACQRPLMFARSGIPDLDRLVLGPTDQSKGIGSKRPDALDMAEEAVDAAARGHVPKTDRAIEGASEHVGGW